MITRTNRLEDKKLQNDETISQRNVKSTVRGSSQRTNNFHSIDLQNSKRDRTSRQQTDRQEDNFMMNKHYADLRLKIGAKKQKNALGFGNVFSEDNNSRIKDYDSIPSDVGGD